MRPTAEFITATTTDRFRPLERDAHGVVYKFLITTDRDCLPGHIVVRFIANHTADDFQPPRICRRSDGHNIIHGPLAVPRLEMYAIPEGLQGFVLEEDLQGADAADLDEIDIDAGSAGRVERWSKSGMILCAFQDELDEYRVWFDVSDGDSTEFATPQKLLEAFEKKGGKRPVDSRMATPMPSDKAVRPASSSSAATRQPQEQSRATVNLANQPVHILTAAELEQMRNIGTTFTPLKIQCIIHTLTSHPSPWISLPKIGQNLDKILADSALSAFVHDPFIDSTCTQKLSNKEYLPAMIAAGSRHRKVLRGKMACTTRPKAARVGGPAFLECIVAFWADGTPFMGGACMRCMRDLHYNDCSLAAGRKYRDLAEFERMYGSADVLG